MLAARARSDLEQGFGRASCVAKLEIDLTPTELVLHMRPFQASLSVAFSIPSPVVDTSSVWLLEAREFRTLTSLLVLTNLEA